MGYKYIDYEEKDGVGWIILKRPERLNALNTELIYEFMDFIDRANNDPGINFIAITGEGKIFCAGIDLSEVARKEKPEDSGKIFEDLAKLFKKIINTDKPVILALNGDAYGGGAEMIWTADIVVAVKGSRLGWFEAKWGLLPPILSGLGSLIIGFARAAGIAMTSGIITVEQAYEWGLVTKLVDSKDNLVEEVNKIVKAIMENSPQAIRSIKRVLRSVKASVIVDLGASELERLARSDEAIKAARSFVEKRKPIYKW